MSKETGFLVAYKDFFKEGPHAILTVFMLPLDCVLLPSGQDEVQVEAGADATLDCQGPTEGTITVIAWNKRGMQTDGYVFFYREDRPYKAYQHPSFQGRVELGDPQMKGGNMSIILHNTTVNDTGTYECHISYQSGSGRDKRVTPEIISEISLKVVHAGESETSLPVCLWMKQNRWVKSDLRVQPSIFFHLLIFLIHVYLIIQSTDDKPHCEQEAGNLSMYQTPDST